MKMADLEIRHFHFEVEKKFKRKKKHAAKDAPLQKRGRAAGQGAHGALLSGGRLVSPRHWDDGGRPPRLFGLRRGIRCPPLEGLEGFE